MKPIAAMLSATALALTAFTLVPQGARAADDAKKPAPVDALFAREASSMNRAEIDAGKNAADNASTPAVKAFAQKMVDDHTAAGDKLKKISDQMDFSLPDSADSAHSSFMTDLKSLKGADYERAYIQAMVADHGVAIALFEDEAKNGNDPMLKQFAQETLPTLQQHLQEAKSLQGSVSNSGEAGAANK